MKPVSFITSRMSVNGTRGKGVPQVGAERPFDIAVGGQPFGGPRQGGGEQGYRVATSHILKQSTRFAAEVGMRRG